MYNLYICIIYFFNIRNRLFRIGYYSWKLNKVNSQLPNPLPNDQLENQKDTEHFNILLNENCTTTALSVVFSLLQDLPKLVISLILIVQHPEELNFNNPIFTGIFEIIQFILQEIYIIIIYFRVSGILQVVSSLFSVCMLGWSMVSYSKTFIKPNLSIWRQVWLLTW